MLSDEGAGVHDLRWVGMDGPLAPVAKGHSLGCTQACRQRRVGTFSITAHVRTVVPNVDRL
jgi:hypothetical protein